MIHFLNEPLRTFRVADFFDIAVISILIYLILIWFKATASRFVLLGMSIIGAIYIIARHFHMYLSTTVLQSFFTILLIALVIIFQEELRRFFERISIWGPMRARHSVISEYPEIEMLARALTDLARRKIGALVVVRGNDPLDRHLEGGFNLNGELSEVLLESIFDPHSPGHDGAAIIEKGRVMKFGCHLPLSVHGGRAGAMGTRHSAALGLAERSDALCIVASEERGKISVAHEEKLIEMDEPSDLSAVLQRFYLDKFPTSAQKTWRHWVTENLWEKAVAVLVSCGLWFMFVYQAGTLSRDFVVPIEYRNLASDWILEEPKPKEATVTLLGRTPAFELMDAQALRITLDMSGVREGAQQMIMSTDSVSHPSSLSVISVEPEKITLIAHQMIPISLPVKVQTSGRVRGGLELVGIEVSPPSVPVVAPNKRYNGSPRVLTDPIDLAALSSTATITPTLILPEGVRLVDREPPEVKVKITIRKTRKE
ncbi:MAG: DNA integrity scanning protein DisA nucleotide-binding domain protein [Candidatus Lindowbacteria bacterium]|nr:DNA integrity scanning protein DisA nucleotide-binding domain protein [Candidatus Lindowbacteria bacterium]